MNIQVRLNRLSLPALEAEARSCGLSLEGQEFDSPEAKRQYLIGLVSQFYRCHSRDVSCAANGVVYLAELSKPTILVLAKECSLVPLAAEWKDAPRDIYEQVASAMMAQSQSASADQVEPPSATTLPAERPACKTEPLPSRWLRLFCFISAKFGRVVSDPGN